MVMQPERREQEKGNRETNPAIPRSPFPVPGAVRRITDARDFGRVAVVMGGSSSEREVSLNSG
ncbi:MAG TPA: hypothetical protein VFI81_03950, partial [Rhodanobacteraceae bacterium]|nr:hypothetical protein [Rhodanobacteraceae bacterium]